jgi:hypothetical protein
MPRNRRENESGLNKAFVDRRLDDNFQLRYPGAFSATDIYATINLPGWGPRSMGSLVAISLSTHRDTFPVTSMPYVDPRGFTQGHRTTAGTMIFHTIDRNAFFYTNRNGNSEPNELVKHFAVRGTAHMGPPHPDTLPLFDVHINYVNQEGMLSFEAVYGVRILDFGKTVSLENLHPAESYSFMALEYDPMRVILSGDREERKFMLDRIPNKEPQKLKRAEDSNFNKRFQPLVDEIFRDIVP